MSSPESMSRRYTFGPDKRLKKNEQFAHVFEQRCSIADSHLIVYACRNELTYSRLGLGVGKKLGSAVVRNRYKRHLREAFRLSQHELEPPGDLVLIPRPTRSPSTQQYRRSLLELYKRLQRRLGKMDAEPKGGDSK